MSRGGDGLIAYVDESKSHDVYSMTAVLVEFGKSHQDLAAKVAEHGNPGTGHHSTEATPYERGQMTSMLAQHQGLQAIVTVKAPVTGGEKQARRQCLAELVVRSHAAAAARGTKLNMMQLDEPGGRNPDERKERIQDDKRTIKECIQAGYVKPFIHSHHRDQDKPGIQAADAVAWAARDAIVRDDPNPLTKFAGKIQLHEARIVLPSDQGRNAPGRPATPQAAQQPRALPPTPVTPLMARLQATAELNAAQRNVRAAQRSSDPDVRSRLANLEKVRSAAKGRLDRAESKVPRGASLRRITGNDGQQRKPGGSDRRSR